MISTEPTIAQTILSQIKATSFRLMLCWGARNFVDMGKGLKFQVSGYLHKGYVYVIYDEGMDTYIVQIAKIKKSEWVVLKEVNDVHCEELGDLIDSLVEQKS